MPITPSAARTSRVLPSPSRLNFSHSFPVYTDSRATMAVPQSTFRSVFSFELPSLKRRISRIASSGAGKDKKHARTTAAVEDWVPPRSKLVVERTPRYFARKVCRLLTTPIKRASIGTLEPVPVLPPAGPVLLLIGGEPLVVPRNPSSAASSDMASVSNSSSYSAEVQMWDEETSTDSDSSVSSGLVLGRIPRPTGREPAPLPARSYCGIEGGSKASVEAWLAGLPSCA